MTAGRSQPETAEPVDLRDRAALRVGVVAPPWVPVPPVGYGGTEGVVDTLVRGLRAAGHDVRLFATGDSACDVPIGYVFATPAGPMNTTLPELRHVQGAYEALADCDVVHDHTLAGPVWARAIDFRVPVVSTNHGEFDEVARPVFRRIAQWAAVTAISHQQRAAAPEVPVFAVVHHGVDVSRSQLGPGDGGYLAFVGRMSPVKGVREAIEIARRAGLPIRVVAKMREEVEEQYFEEQVRPVLGDDVELLGELSPTERDHVVGHALGLLNPIAWDEPFGLVMVEALALGTPVVTFPRGAAPEIVENGITGFLCDDVAAAVAAVRQLPELDRRACRASVEARFSMRHMTFGYESVYRRVLSRSTAELTA